MPWGPTEVALLRRGFLPAPPRVQQQLTLIETTVQNLAACG